jgi:uncharacterized membrane protein
MKVREDGIRKLQMVVLLGLALSVLTACGSTRADRTLSGAGIGAAVGAVGGAVVAGNPAAGAVIGGAAGAAAGALTDQADINLGRPIWRR